MQLVFTCWFRGKKIVDLFIFIWQLCSELLIVTTWTSSLQTSANAQICSHCSNVGGGGNSGARAREIRGQKAGEERVGSLYRSNFKGLKIQD